MMVLFYDDLEVGQRFVSASRTITETDVVQFAMFSGDWNRLHTDAEYARGTSFGERIVHGTLGLVLVTGLIERMGVFAGSTVAMLGVREWRFEAPIFIGDTVHCEVVISAMRKTRRGDRGIVERKVSLIKQAGEVAQAGITELMMELAAPGVDAR